MNDINTYEGYIYGSTGKYIYILIKASDIDIASKKLMSFYDQNISDLGDLMDISIQLTQYEPHRNLPYITI